MNCWWKPICSKLIRLLATIRFLPLASLPVLTALQWDTALSAIAPLIFSALVNALQFDPVTLRHDAEQLQSLAQQQPAQVIALLTTANSELHLEPLSSHLRAIAANPQFKYSRLFAVGLFTLIETADASAWQDSDRRKALLQSVSATLKISEEKLQRDLEVYQSSLEKLQQSLQMMADLVEAERKKREKQPSLTTTPQQ